MTRLPLGLIIWFLKTVIVKGSLPFLGISSSLGTLLDRIPDKSVSINIIYDETESLQMIQAGTLAHFIEHDLETPVILIGDLKVFWPIIRSQRMAWRGSVNIVLLGMDEKVGYLKRLHERFFTGFGLRLADERRMDLLYENIYHMFPFETWQSWTQSKLAIEELLEESLNLIAIYPLNQLSPVKLGISWNKANSLGLNKLEQVNSWTESDGLLYKSYLVPLAVNTYSSLAGRHFQHPVMHKPPWNYVTLDQFDNFVEDNGGRDITLCHILAGKLGFTFEPIDPKALGIARSRGSQWDTQDYNFSGILGKLHRREEPIHFYLGDTTQTYTRNSAVDFSFMVLADSGAFVSQAPSRFVPNDILIRPFSWPVWAFTLGSMVTVWLLLIMILQYGKCMYRNRDSGIVPYDGNTTLLTESLARSVAKTGFMIYRIFFHEPEMYIVGHNHPFLRPLRILAMGVMIVVGLVLLPSYNGSLFSFFYVPFFRKPLDSLPELHKMMQQANHTLGVTAGSSSFEIISTGGGIYNDLWREMEQQGNWLIPSVQEGLLQTLSDPTFSVFAGREKLIFDSLRLGGKDKLHINKEVFFTKYKAIAMRTGSPLKQPFNHVLQRLTDAGIIGKITQDEYNGLTKREGSNSQYWTEMYRVVLSDSADKEGARPLGWTQFQGLFFIAALGYSLALVSFLIENFARLPPNIPKIQSKFRALKQIYIHGF